jgi:hypothetical protein
MSASERWKKKKAGVEEDPQEKKNKVRTVYIILALLAVLCIRIRIWIGSKKAKMSHKNRKNIIHFIY